MLEHRFAGKLDRILQGQVPLLRFFTESAWALRDPTDPENADFVAGNPQEMVMPECVEALKKWALEREQRFFDEGWRKARRAKTGA